MLEEPCFILQYHKKSGWKLAVGCFALLHYDNNPTMQSPLNTLRIHLPIEIQVYKYYLYGAIKLGKCYLHGAIWIPRAYSGSLLNLSLASTRFSLLILLRLNREMGFGLVVGTKELWGTRHNRLKGTTWLETSGDFAEESYNLKAVGGLKNLSWD